MEKGVVYCVLRNYAMIGALNIALKTVGNTSYPRHDDKRLVTDYVTDSGDNNPLIAQFEVMPLRYSDAVKEAHVSQIVTKAEDYNSSSSQLQVDDLACQLAPGGYIIACTRGLKLDQANYLIWRSQVLASIRGNKLEKLINDSITPPPSHVAQRVGDDVRSVENPNFISWRSQDQVLLGWLLSSMSEGIISLVFNLETSREVWKVVEVQFGSQSKSRLLHLRYMINSTRKDDMKITYYFIKMKNISDNMAAAGSALSNDDLILHVLSGLGPDYNSVATYITGQVGTGKMDLNEAYAMLLTQEARIEQQSHMLAGTDMKNNFEPNFAQNRGPKKGNMFNGKGFGSYGYNSGSGNNYNSGFSNNGHYKGNFGTEFAGAYRPPPNRGPKAAYLANMDAPVDNNWFLDSGATHHLTNDMSNMNGAEPFTGNSKLIVGNGVGLCITQLGSAVLRMPDVLNYSDLKLNNILLVPKITKNLISISQLTKDNDVVVEFTDSFCFVKDKLKNSVMLQSKAEKGLYRLLCVSSTKFSPSQSNQGLLTHVESAVSSQPISMFSTVVSKFLNKIACCLHTEALCCQTPSCMLNTMVLQQRLGHPNTKVLSHVINSCSSLKNISGNKTIDSCDACKMGKMHKLHFPITETKTKNPLEFLHTDLWGPSPTPSIQGYKYYVSFVDDFTRAKTGIFKPKAFLTAHNSLEPSSVDEALADPKTKYNTNGSVSKYKAQFVAKGFHQTAGVYYSETYSPVVKSSTVRVILSLAVMQGWNIRQIDINNAFLNGDLIEDVYMQQPEDFVLEGGYICKLNKALYGLKQAPRAWYDKLKGCLTDWNFTNSKADTSLFIRHDIKGIILVLIYVDDVLVTGPDSVLLEAFITNLSKVFALKDLGLVSYFLGIEVSYTDHGMHLSQTKYIKDLLAKASMQNCKETETPFSTGYKLERAAKGLLGAEFENPTLYRSIVGGLQYLILTRPDIAYSVHKLSQYLSAPTLQHWLACKKVLRYLQATITHGLYIQQEGTLETIGLTGYSDADWACDIDDRKSIGAYCIFLGNNLVSWSSKKQAIVAQSSTESEYRALSAASSELTWLQSLFFELKIIKLPTPVLWCDNQGAGDLAKNPVFHSKSKHIELDVHYIRDKVLNKELEVRYIPTEEQVADVLTKPLSFPKFSYFRSKLNVINRPLSLRGDVKEAHVSQIVTKAEDYNSSSSQLQVDDLACRLAPGGYIIACTRGC
ncbi:retrovirus-related pol polyprotein from transposon RE1 [Citrus sinensis]|nr:retrovirus-related pol polyprotein from transposon RE1 [Citrus sinensis]